MRVRVLYFAALRERVGLAEEDLELAAGASVKDLRAALDQRHASLRGLTGFRVAVNQRFARDQDEVPEGAEVALIPPVAGGVPEDAAAGGHTALTRDPIDAAALLEQVADPGAGAQVVFLGVVRDHHRGQAVARMDYQAYEAMARAELARIAERLRQQHPEVRRVAMVHRFGCLEIGEASVGVAVSSAHRKAAFAACEWGIDAIKESVPIWKQEHYRSGERHWVRADEMGERETGGAPQVAPGEE